MCTALVISGGLACRSLHWDSYVHSFMTHGLIAVVQMTFHCRKMAGRHFGDQLNIWKILINDGGKYQFTCQSVIYVIRPSHTGR